MTTGKTDKDKHSLHGFLALFAGADGEGGFHLYDLQLYQFGEELFVVDAAPSLQQAIGARLVAIGDLPVDDVRTLLEPLVAHENDMFVANYLPLFAVTPELLAALDIVQDPAQPAFQLEDAAGSRFTLHPPILDLPETLNLAQSFEQLLLPPRPELLYLSRHREQRFWHTFLEQDNTLYVQYNLVQPTTQTGQSIVGFVSALEESLQENDVARVVLDLRHNMGGELGNQEPLLEWLQAYDAAHPGALYVLIGRQTFSAAAFLTAQLEQTTGAVFVGEPTGSQPNFFANSRRILLPNSGLTAHVSTRYFEPSTPGDDRPGSPPTSPHPPPPKPTSTALTPPSKPSPDHPSPTNA